MSARPKLLSKNCAHCGEYLTGASYYPTKSPFFPGGTLSICKECLTEMVDCSNWEQVDKFCQWADYPFLLDVWLKIYAQAKEKTLEAYVKGFTNGQSYETLYWKDAHEEWRTILESGEFRDRIPALSEENLAQLQLIWGKDYKPEELHYMENFYQRLCKSHNIITPTQEDNARNLAKLSIRISEKISNGADVDKDIKSSSELMKTGGFTTENVKNMSDFESVGELVAYLEKTGWRNPYYDGTSKDIVDETIANMQSFTRRLVMGESNLKETVDQKLAAMGIGNSGSLDLSDDELERYEAEGFGEIEMEIVLDDDEVGEMDV